MNKILYSENMKSNNEEAEAYRNAKKEAVVKRLEKEGSTILMRFVQNGMIDPDDSIAMFPLSKIAEYHLKLKEDRYQNQKAGSSYEEKASKVLNDNLQFFRTLYPGATINASKLKMRQKSPKSICDKIKTLAIERYAKILALESEIMGPNSENVALSLKNAINDYLSENNQEKHGRKPVLNNDEKREEIFYKNQIFKTLLIERIKEGIVNPANLQEQKQEQEDFINRIKDLIDGNNIDYKEISEVFLNEPRLSNATKTALARTIYARMNSDRTRIITDMDGNTYVKDITDNERKSIKNEFREKYQDQLLYESIIRLETDTPEWQDKVYDGRYHSRLNRLVDIAEFARCKDLYGTHIIIDKIDENANNACATLNEKISARNNTIKMEKERKRENPSYDANNSESQDDEEKADYNEFTQSCVDIMANDYITKLRGEGITAKYLANHPNIKATMEELFREIKIVPEVHNKNKSNGYKAVHVKFEIDNNPNYTLEAQIKSDLVYEKSRGNGPAAHSKRFGKQRIIPNIFGDENVDMDNLTEEQIKNFDLNSLTSKQVERLRNQFEFYLPIYYKIKYDEKSNKYICTRCGTAENCREFYADLALTSDGDNSKERKPTEREKRQRALFYKIIEAAEKYGDNREVDILQDTGKLKDTHEDEER